MVIPTALRPTIMKEVRSGHFGIVKRLERAKAAVYWPGYTLQIRDMVESCSLCQEHRRANSNMPLQQHPVTDHPYQVVGTDLFELDGQVYLLSVDFYSKWVCVEALQETRSIDVIRVLEKQFVDFGCPQRLISDNGPQYGSFEFREFAKRMNFEHVTSSPSYARSNVQSERTIQTFKKSLIKMLSNGKTLAETLIALRSTPVGNDLPSPAVLLQGRNLRSGLHCHSESLMPKVVSPQQVKRCLLDKQGQCTFYHDANKSFKDPLTPNQTVRVRKERRWVPATVVTHTNNPQSYWVRLTNGYMSFDAIEHRSTRPAKRACKLPLVSLGQTGLSCRIVSSGQTGLSCRIVSSGQTGLSCRIVSSGQTGLSCRIVSSGQTGLSCRIVSSGQTGLSCRIVSLSQTGLSCRIVSSQTGLSHRIVSSQTGLSYRIVSSQTGLSCRVVSGQTRP